MVLDVTVIGEGFVGVATAILLLWARRRLVTINRDTGGKKMESGSITLSQIASRSDVLVVACTRCDWADQYRLDTLIAQHSKHLGVPELLRLVSTDCSRRKSCRTDDLCGIHCPDLAALLATPAT